MSSPRRTLYAMPAVAAYAAGVQVATIRQWARRGHISPAVNGCYDLADVVAYSDSRAERGHEVRAIRSRTRRHETRPTREACETSNRL